MTNAADTSPPDGDDTDLMLPWYATDRLEPEERARVADALARDPDLARRLQLAEEELSATVAVHEALPAPSGRVRQDLFARIDALEGTRGRAGETGGLLGRVIDFFESLSPRTTAMAAGFAALLILVQAGFLAEAVLERRASFEVASHGEAREAGSFALVTFVPGASIERIVIALDAEGMGIAAGPYPGGVFRIRLSTSRLDRGSTDEAIARLRRADVVRMAVAAEGE